MPASDSLTVRMRAIGAQATAASIKGVTRSLTGLESATKRVDRGMGRIATGAAALTGLGVAATFRKMATEGWNYNQMLDRQRVGFTTYIGSQKEAAKFMKQIQQLALESPVLDPQTTGEAARRLMSYGIALKDTLPWVKALGDMSAASGKSMQEVMPLGAKAIGQIASKDKLQAEELNQLAESVGLSRQNIRKALKMSRADFEATFTPGNNLKAKQALPAILKAMEMQSAGAADRLAKTTEGRMQRLKEVVSRALAEVTRPFYDEIGRLAGGIANKLQDIWTPEDTGSGGLLPNLRYNPTVGEKIKQSWTAVKPIIQQAIKDLEVGKKLTDAAKWAGPAAARAFFNAFKAAPIWLQLAGGGWLMTKLGVTGKLLTLLRGKGAAKLGMGERGSINNPMYVFVVNGPAGWGKPTKPTGPGSKIKKLLPFGAAAAPYAAALGMGALAISPALVASQINPRRNVRRPGQPGGPDSRTGRRNVIPGQGGGGQVYRPVPDSVPYRPGAGAGGRPSSPFLPDSARSPVFHANIHIDGKKVAEATTRAARKRESTR